MRVSSTDSAGEENAGGSGDASDVSDNGTASEAAKSDGSGDVYDFKDPKTTGVVTVIKQWDDSLTNEERPVPDISISTEKPSKSALGYTVTYHGNGLAFEDGSDTNEIIVNSSGKIVSGQYKVPGGLLDWYSDEKLTNKVELSAEGVPEGLGGDMDLYAKGDFALKTGSSFRELIPSTATTIVFTDELMPSDATLINVSADENGGVVSWMDGTVMKVSTQAHGQRVDAAADCSSMFSYKSNLTSIDLGNLDTSKVSNMRYMFQSCSSLTGLDLSPLNTGNVTDMGSMFQGCSGLIELDLTHLDTSKVTNMRLMFQSCSGLTKLDLTSLDTSKVTDMYYMFGFCSGLTSINISYLDVSQVTDMGYMFFNDSNLESIDLPSFTTSALKSMSYMFYNCNRLTDLDLSSLNTGNVTDMGCLFENCRNLAELNLSHLDTGNVSSIP